DEIIGVHAQLVQGAFGARRSVDREAARGEPIAQRREEGTIVFDHEQSHRSGGRTSPIAERDSARKAGSLEACRLHDGFMDAALASRQRSYVWHRRNPRARWLYVAFTTRTDTEVILHAYEDEGPACLERLEGMFAFALWDGRRQRLVLARDRFGEKPLYYARLSRTLLFASEPKALLMHPRVSRELDWTALARYLTYEYVPAPHAIFRAVRKLPPAHWMAVGVGGGEAGGRYWTPPAPGTIRPTKRQAAEGVLDLLRRSVRRRLACDVPWGP